MKKLVFNLGYTLIELLVIIGIGGVVALGIGTAFNFFQSTNLGHQRQIQVGDELDELAKIARRAVERRGIADAMIPIPLEPIGGNPIWANDGSACPCSDLRIYQASGNIPGVYRQISFQTDCAIPDTYSKSGNGLRELMKPMAPNGPLGPSIICPDGRLPRVVMRTVEDIAKPGVFNERIFPSGSTSAVAFSLCFRSCGGAVAGSVMIHSAGVYQESPGRVGVVTREHSIALSGTSVNVEVLPPGP